MRPPEMLLAQLVAAPAGVPPTSIPAAAQAVLEARGHQLIAASTGVRLACAALHFDPHRFAAAQSGRFGAELEVWEALDSTNARAAAAAAAGAPVGTVIVAELQTRGRGRHGRVWDCPAHAGLLFSVLLPGALGDSARPQLLPLALAVGVATALRRSTGLDVWLKWPNDLVLAGSPPRKVGGILLEAHPPPGAGVIAGCGLNVDVPPEFFAGAGLTTAAALAVPQARREILLAAVLAEMERRFTDWEAARWSELVEAWTALDVLRGCAVAIVHGAARHVGAARGITPHGLLQVETSDGTRREFAAGEVHLQ